MLALGAGTWTTGTGLSGWFFFDGKKFEDNLSFLF